MQYLNVCLQILLQNSVKKSGAQLGKFGFTRGDSNEEIAQWLEDEKETKKDGKAKLKRPSFDDLVESISEMGLNGFNGAPLAKRPSKFSFVF